MKRQLQFDKRNDHYFVWIQHEGIKKYFRFGTNKREAERELAELEVRIVKGEVAFAEQSTLTVLTNGKKDMRIEELAVKHLEWVKNNRSPGTFKNRQYFVQAFLGFIGPAMVSDITRIKLEEFYAWAKKNHARGENGGNQIYSHIKTLLRWGEEMELVDLNFKRFPPMSYTPPETKRIPEDTLRLILSREPLNEAPPAIDYQLADELYAMNEFQDMLHFGLLTGLRPQELRMLSKQQVQQTSAGTYYVNIQRHKTSRTAGEPKPRTVPLNAKAEEIYLRQLELHPTSSVIFVNADGTPYTRYSLKTRLRRLCQRLKIKVIAPYALRHTFASMNSEGGMETTSLAHLMGHSSTRTVGRYISNNFPHYKQAVDALGNRLEGILNGQGSAEKADVADASLGQKLPPKLPPTKKGLQPEAVNP